MEQTNEKRMIILPDDRMRALADLHINPTHKKNRDESPAFLLYLNYAVNNICDITEIGQETSSTGVINEIKNKDLDPKTGKSKGNIRKLANFLWLFNEDNPSRDFPDYEKKTLAVAEKIYQLREYFAHLNESGAEPLSVDRDMYVFIAGILASQALKNSVKPGLQTSKLFKMKLFAVRNKEKQIYEFTRRGLIFFICLALYREDAMEFTQCLEDMKLPACPKGQDIQSDCPCECDDIAVCKPGVAKAFISMFTYFSVRRGRSVNLLADDLNYMSFADITGYLNKVPAESMDYLALENEKSKLNALAEASSESEKNKLWKYSLHKRMRNRFLSFAAAYCEDFGILPSLHFKRLDISDNEGRKRYSFGKENDNRVHMDRHYQIEKDAIRFEWRPKKHYGNIHIDFLRSAISASAMKELLFSFFAKENPDRFVNEYFTAYHRILETILNTVDPDDIVLDDLYLKDFVTVSDVAPEILNEDLSPLYLNGFFSENLIRFFTGNDSMPNDDSLREELIRKLQAMWDHAADFKARLEKFNEWKIELGKLREKDTEAKLPKPVCSSEDVVNPPRNCNISDASLIAWVFRFFNLFLENDKKFRQLPPGEQHRGAADFEYQTVHALIGKYSLDPQGLTGYIERKKPELLSALEQMNTIIQKMKKEETQRRPKKYNSRGKLISARPSLAMLASAALDCYINFCEKKVKFWENDPKCSSDKLRKTCRKFGIRTGMPLDRNSLIKTLLHIDLAAWMKAYDREHHANFENRSLDQNGHVVSQIPFPNDFAQRIMRETRNFKLNSFIRRAEGRKPFFDFSAAIRSMGTEISPRDFYETTPLTVASYALRNGQDPAAVPGINSIQDPGILPADFSRAAIDRAIRTIKNTAAQDRILLRIAYAYWNSFQSSGAFFCSKKKNQQLEQSPCISDFFNASVLIKFKDKGDDRTIRIMPNDINRPILSQIQVYAPEIAAFMDPEGKQDSFEFYEMMKAYRMIQTLDRAKRMEIVPLINAFESDINIPKENFNQEMSSDEKRKMAFSFYQKKYPALTFEEFVALVKLRNAVYHRGLDLKIEDGKKILSSYVRLPGNAHSAKRYSRMKNEMRDQSPVICRV